MRYQVKNISPLNSELKWTEDNEWQARGIQKMWIACSVVDFGRFVGANLPLFYYNAWLNQKTKKKQMIER